MHVVLKLKILIKQKCATIFMKIGLKLNRDKIQSNFGSSNVSFSNPSESSKTAVGPEFSAIYFMHF